MSIDRRVLIADDDSEVRLGVAELLDGLGLEVHLAQDGREALSLARTIVLDGPMHLAMLDVHMPGHGGLEVFGQLRDMIPDLPCIFWSGDATDAIERTAMHVGASAFLRKPLKPDVLRMEVQRVLDHHWGESA